MTIPGNRVLIEPTESVTKLPSGLFLPDSAIQKPNTGTVVVIGTEADSLLMGKTVLYNRIVAIEIDGKHLLHITDLKFIL